MDAHHCPLHRDAQGQVTEGSRGTARGKARCTWRITAGTTGAQLKAKVTAVAGGKTFTA